MSRLLSIIFIFAFILVLPNFVQAIDVNMNLENTVTSNNTISGENTENATTIPQTYNGSSGTVSTLSSLPEANLGLSNILSIILIVIGVLLILLAIAILIRLKH